MRITKTFLLGCLVTVVGLTSRSAWAQSPILNTTWHTVYETADKTPLRSIVQIGDSVPGQGAGGSYTTYDDQDQPILEGTLSQVRVEMRSRSANFPKNVPLPPPGNSLGATVTETPNLVGCWQAAGCEGWFKWEVFEDRGQVRFVGEWGFLENGQQGPSVGSWNGYLNSNNDPSTQPTSAGNASTRSVPLIRIR